ncbi:hypothetical protein Salat_1579200 [Sesamum alatum]|uniref:mRNA export factor GLE1 n=1 Tax=Sesamum alatum TaxID=300844 RepID=A0AAE2CMY0_9LAMI|nr:hypothetical protein Salat_1579200 [Sesamum alatum]
MVLREVEPFVSLSSQPSVVPLPLLVVGVAVPFLQASSIQSSIAKDTYFKAIGYEAENGSIKGIGDYVERLSCYMKLYGAIVQTEEVGDFQNLHGIREDWAWLGRFLNSLPANLYTTVALHSFLEMVGFSLYRRYRNQFEKLVNIVARDFVNALKEGGSESWSAKLSKVEMSIQDYIESNQFKKEPNGLQLSGHLVSNHFY